MILEQNFQKPAILSGGGGASTQSSSLSFSLATSLTAHMGQTWADFVHIYCINSFVPNK